MHRKIIVVAVVAVAGFVLASSAAASNWPSGRLDTAASAVAGHPVQVWCEENWGDWIHLGDDYSEDFSYLMGFTFPSEPIVYINPAHCETLHALLGGSQVGSYHSSSRYSRSPTRRCISAASTMRASPTAPHYRSCPASPPTTSASRGRSLGRRS